MLGAGHDAGWFQLIVGQQVADRRAEDQIASVLKNARARARNGDLPASTRSNGTGAGALGAGADAPREHAAEERGQLREARELSAGSICSSGSSRSST
jgi:hypothetical protein